MKTLLNQIIEIDFHHISEKQLFYDLKKASKLISANVVKEELVLIQNDFDFYLDKGKFWVYKTFAGGIIFLREPETIKGIKIEFDSYRNEGLASVEYDSENRNERNVKYKPNAGKIESAKWKMAGIFPNFNKHDNNVKVVLIAIIGKIVKRICEQYRKHSWFMKFEKEFDIKLFLDNEIILQLNVEID